MADTGLILGLAGIAGTLVGALSANGVTFLVERRKDRREDDTARGEVRRAARLVGTEIQEAIGAVDTALSSGTLWSAGYAPSRTAWLDYAPLLATNLKTEEYRCVARAYVLLKEDLAIAPSTDGAELAEPYLEGLRVTQQRLKEASAAVDRLAALD